MHRENKSETKKPLNKPLKNALIGVGIFITFIIGLLIFSLANIEKTITINELNFKNQVAPEIMPVIEPPEVEEPTPEEPTQIVEQPTTRPKGECKDGAKKKATHELAGGNGWKITLCAAGKWQKPIVQITDCETGYALKQQRCVQQAECQAGDMEERRNDIKDGHWIESRQCQNQNWTEYQPQTLICQANFKALNKACIVAVINLEPIDEGELERIEFNRNSAIPGGIYNVESSNP